MPKEINFVWDFSYSTRTKYLSQSRNMSFFSVITFNTLEGDDKIYHSDDALADKERNKLIRGTRQLRKLSAYNFTCFAYFVSTVLNPKIFQEISLDFC